MSKSKNVEEALQYVANMIHEVGLCSSGDIWHLYDEEIRDVLYRRILETYVVHNVGRHLIFYHRLSSPWEAIVKRHQKRRL